MTTNGRHGSVQEMLPLEEIVEGVLCLRGGDYRAVIQVQSVNFALKSEEEQEAVMAAYRSFLNSLSHPVQMLVRILPTNVEPYPRRTRYVAPSLGHVAHRGKETTRDCDP